MSESERGSALPFIMLFVVFAAMLVGAELRLAQVFIEREEAQNAADAVALAAVMSDSATAKQVADANHVSIEALTISDGRATVRVRAGAGRASAIAAQSRSSRPPALRSVLVTASAVLHAPVRVLEEGVDWIETDDPTSKQLVGRSDLTGLCASGPHRWVVCR